jgi:FkbM family methyltransferase
MRVPRFVRSTQLLWMGNGQEKFSRWLNLCRLSLWPSSRVLGFEVEHFNPESLLHLYHEIFARDEYLFFSAAECPVILDCGANIGLATFFFKWLYPKSTVLAFEPDPATFRVLRRNVEENGLEGVSLQNVALWDAEGDLPFYVARNETGSALMSANSRRNQGQEISVRARRLSEFIRGPIDLLKLDVEGAEHQVLCDLANSGKINQVRQMIVEYHHNLPAERSRFGEFLSILETYGFSYQINSSVYRGGTGKVFQDILVYASQAG